MTKEQFEDLRKLYYSENIKITWDGDNIDLEEEVIRRYVYEWGEYFPIYYHYEDVNLSELDFAFTKPLTFEEALALHNE
jgi:hypothetical protein